MVGTTKMHDLSTVLTLSLQTEADVQDKRVSLNQHTVAVVKSRQNENDHQRLECAWLAARAGESVATDEVRQNTAK
jgi:hypothetical protein